MDNNLFIVTGIDTEINDKVEYEESSLEHALEIYNTLKDDADITNLNILQYDLVSQEYHIIDMTEF